MSAVISRVEVNAPHFFLGKLLLLDVKCSASMMVDWSGFARAAASQGEVVSLASAG